MSALANNLGGKAQGLRELQNLGFQVPQFVIFSYEKFTTDHLQDFEKKLNELEGSFFAVRSSANVEDGTENSFAGMFTSKLFVQPKYLLTAIEEVYASKNSEQVKTYCVENNIEHDKIQMNVIVQEMIEADVSGVAFGTNPTKPYRNEKVISAVYGLGEGLVSGKLDADEFIVKKNQKIQNRIAVKGRAYRHENSSLDYFPVDESLQEKPSLSDEQVNEIALALDKLESELGAPQDVEFCYKNNKLYLLQTRPITTLNKEHIIWDNSNIVESYPGVTSPFTFSFILKLYEAVYKNFVGLLGVPQKHIAANQNVFAYMLGHIHGRVYYHLIHWYQALALLPAYQLNAGFMENMMGVSEPLGVEVKQIKSSKWYNYLLLFKMAIRGIGLNRKLPKLKKEFSKRVENIIKNHKKKDYSNNTDKEIWEDFLKFKNVLVNDWFPPLANDLLAMIYFGTLQKLCKNWLGNEAMANQWIIGRHKVKSAEPPILVEKILAELKHENYLEKIKKQRAEKSWKEVEQGKLGMAGTLILEYIETYGDRSVGELKIENETYAQNPLAFIEVLSSYNAEPIKRKKPKQVEPDLSALSFFKRKIIRYVANKSAEMVADRENLRFDRTLAFGMARRFMNSISKRWLEQKIIKNEKDIFYLKEEEIDAYFNKEISAAEIAQIILERQKEFSEYEKEDGLPERIHQWDGVLHIENDEPLEARNENEWQGLACCAGIVEAKVRIVRTPNEVKSLEGDILVCTSTDPGWISIFRSASGILVERGSALSHAAIVCREMGIPCIVGVKGLSKNLETGDQVHMNGATGLVRKYEA